MSNIGKVGIWLILSLLSAAAQAGTKYYYYTDPQGTVLAEADAQGNIIARYDYAPYGKQVLGTPPSGPAGYTGHVNDAESGLVYMQQRYYDPTAGRFVSIDPVTAAESPLGAFNRYWYANDNPLRYIDPDGREIACDVTTCVLEPDGGGLHSIKFPRPIGFPANINELTTFHHEYRFVTPAGAGNASYGKRLSNALVNNPTPIAVKPATAQGSKIDVNVNNAISHFTGKDDVLSYKVALPNGSYSVLNVTTANHAGAWGVVYREVRAGPNGTQSIITYGEGNSMLQRVFDPYDNQAHKVWSKSDKNIIQNAYNSLRDDP